MEFRKGSYSLSSNCTIVAKTHESVAITELLAEYLRPATGFDFPITDEASSLFDIFIDIKNLGKEDAAGFTDESYEIDISEKGIHISSETKAGGARGIQTLRQLFPIQIFSQKKQDEIDWILPEIKIIDSPEFR